MPTVLRFYQVSTSNPRSSFLELAISERNFISFLEVAISRAYFITLLELAILEPKYVTISGIASNRIKNHKEPRDPDFLLFQK